MVTVAKVGPEGADMVAGHNHRCRRAGGPFRPGAAPVRPAAHARGLGAAPPGHRLAAVAARGRAGRLRRGPLRAPLLRDGRRHHLYQDWLPFGLALAYVVVHHTVLGILAPTQVFNHPAAERTPWKWALIHGAFVAAASVAYLVNWRLSERQAVEISRLVSRLEGLARTDPLTGVPNRRVWEEELPRELERARRMGSGLCVAMIDLDDFKSYNDRFGHQAGDLVLKEAASAWRAEVRSTDLLARYGGEEFVLLLPACALEDAVRIVERLRSVTPLVTCSVGLACWDFQEAGGRNRYVLAS